jgi:uncharacterized coiled-coil protein SlyX
MTDIELNTRIESLETRLMHHEASIEELTRTLIDQEQQIRLQTETINLLEAQIKGLQSSAVSPGEEPPPPHY